MQCRKRALAVSCVAASGWLRTLGLGLRSVQCAAVILCYSALL